LAIKPEEPKARTGINLDPADHTEGGEIILRESASRPCGADPMPARRITQLPARFLIVLSATLLSSCLPLDNPLSDPEKAKPATRLFGAWKVTKARLDEGVKEPEYVSILIGKSGLRNAPPSIMKIVWNEIDKVNNIRTDGPWYFFLTHIGDRSYINLVFLERTEPNGAIPPSWDKRKIKKYGLLKFKLEKDKLAFWWGDLKAAESAIRKGQLKGAVEEVGWLKIPITTIAGGEKLSQFLADGGERLLFPEKNKAELSRIK
jgi:hypothetical protein